MGLLDVFRKRRPAWSLRIVGHGIDVTPRLPADVGWLEGDALMIGERAKIAFLKPGRVAQGRLVRSVDQRSTLVKLSAGPGSTELLLPRGETHADGLFSAVRTSDRRGGWTIVTPDHELSWPRGFGLRARGDLDPRRWPYELHVDGSPESLIYVQGPLLGSNIPSPERLRTPTMRLHEEGVLPGAVDTVVWFSATSAIHGDDWMQAFFFVPAGNGAVYLLRAQGTPEVVEAAKNLKLTPA